MTPDAFRVARSPTRAGPGAASRRAALLATLVATALAAAAAHADDAAIAAALGARIVGDGIPEPLAAEPGDPVRGRALLLAREPANCVLCHALPDRGVGFAGDVGPSFGGIGARLSAPQIRLRVADNLRLNPASSMPSYFKVDGLDRVAPRYRGRTILSAREIEDIVAYLATLR